MSLRIAGMGWLTPLGRGLEAVWNRLLRGDEANAQTISDTLETRSYCIFPVPASALKDLPAHPRLRRASAISRFAAAAGLDALADAGVQVTAEIAKRMALVFAISNGGVVYTKRFYRDVVQSGAHQPVHCSSPKQCSTHRPVISLQFSESPARVTHWWAMARLDFWQ
jgi:3-oxoacyl-(acyl-carrier-protein) synthase